MSLRLRLLLVLVGVVAAGLLVADVVTYNQLGSFLSQRTDQELSDSAQTVATGLSRCLAGNQATGPFGSGSSPYACNQYFRFGPGSALPVGTYVKLVDDSGVSLVEGFLGETTATGRAAPVLPAALPGSTSSESAQYFHASNRSGAIHYQVLAEPVDGGGTLVVAFPTGDITSTLGRLALIEVLVTVVVLLALGSLAWWIVRRGLRPLDDMTEAAGAIAGGDLTRRVPDTGGGTEVGRLGVALNTMLSNIERAFSARTASEERLRRFLADASHELRTPLTSIRGYAEMFDRGTKDRPADLATSMRHIQAEADRMSELVTDLLLLARLDRERPLEIERLDLGDVAQQAVAAARVSAPDRIFTLATPGPVPVDGDAGRLRQVVDNLLANSVRHTPAGTPVDVRVAPEGGGAVLEVHDHGPGVPEADRMKIFEPFHRADESRARATGGMGLGLAIVAAITRAHGGSAGVGSNGSDGATFWVRLPLATWSPPAPAAPRPAEHDVTGAAG